VINDGSVNELLAYLVILDQGVTPTTGRVREMVGGAQNVVQQRLIAIRPLVKKQKTKESPVFERFRKEIQQEELDKAGAEIIAMENEFMAQIDDINKAHADELEKLRIELAETKGNLSATLKHLDAANTDTRKFQELYVDARVERSQLLNINNEVTSLKEQLTEKRADLLNLDKAQLKQTQANEIQLTKQKETINNAQKNLTSCLDQLAAANEGIATYKSEVNNLKHEAKQQSLELKEQQVIENIADQVSRALEPVSDLTESIEQAKALSNSKKKDNKQIFVTLTSLETAILNLQELSKKIIKGNLEMKGTVNE